MAYRRLQSGDSPSLISASAYNLMLGLVENRKGGTPEATAAIAANSLGAHSVVTLRNNTGGTLPAFGVARLGGPKFDPADRLETFRRSYTFLGLPPLANETFVISLGPSRAGEFQAAAVSGVVPCVIDVIDADHDRAGPVSNDVSQLRSSFAGSAEILWKEAGTGQKHAMIRFPVSAGRRLMGVTQEAISPSTPGTVRIIRYGNLDVTSGSDGTVLAYLIWMTGNQQISANKQVLVEYFPHHGRWIIVGAECED